MTSLTQVDVSFVEEISSDVNQTVVGYHRLHRTAAVYFLGQDQFDFYECKALFELKWGKLGSWKATGELKNIIGVVALEAYDVFAFIGTDGNGTSIVLVSFDGKIRQKQSVSRRTDAVCVDYNQKTREFFIGFENGMLTCLFTNCSTKYEYSITVKKLIKVSSTANQIPVQIISQDFIGILYVLTNDGNVLCIDGTKFELIYSISRSTFSMQPTRIYCDKFGTDFLVRLQNAEKSKEQLECWHPPEDYASCRMGRFDRFLIPLAGSIVGLSFESVGLYSGRTLLHIFTANRKLQLWSCQGSVSVNLEAEMMLNIPSNSWKQFQEVFCSNRARSTTKDPYFTTLEQHLTMMSYIGNGIPEAVNYSTMLLFNVCQLSLLVGIQLPEKKEREVAMQLADMEIYKYGMMGREERKSNTIVDKMLQQSRQRQEQQQLQRFLQHSHSDDEYSIMSETLVGALTDLAKIERGIDEKISQSQVEGSLYLDSNSSLQLTDHITRDSFSLEQNHPPIKVDATVRMDTPYEPKLAPLDPCHSPPPELAPAKAELIERLSSQPSITELSFDQQQSLHQSQQQSDFISQPEPSQEIQSTYFFPKYYLQNLDMSKCNTPTTSSTALIRLVKPDGMILNDQYQLLTFTHDGIYYLSPELLDTKLSIDYHAVANRLGLIAVVNSFKECLLCDLKNINHPSSGATGSPPLRILLTIKNHVKVTTVAIADVYVKTPPLPTGGQKKKKGEQKQSSSSDSSKLTEPAFTKYLILAVGDSDGFIHIYICDSNHTVLQSESFQAYSSIPVKQVLFSADAVRSLWQVSIDYLPSSNKIGLYAIAGSALISSSVEGEVKIWQPFSMELSNWKGGVSFEKFFQYNQVRWRLAGVFAVNRTYSITVRSTPQTSTGPSATNSKPSTGVAVASANLPPTTATTVKKLREIVSMAIAPSCLSLLITFTNGTIEEWTIPGVLEATDSTGLATSQKEIWSNAELQTEEIVSLRVYIHGPLSTIKTVYLLHDHERDSILAKLATYIRVPHRLKSTVGLNYQEMKALTTSSSLTTCARDMTIVLWSFQSAFYGHCSYLVPLPIRKFYFSSIPSQAICYSLQIHATGSYPGTSMWQLDTIIEGKVQTVITAARDRLFQVQLVSNQSHMIKDYRQEVVVAPSKTNSFMFFEDDVHSRASDPRDAGDDKMVTAIPVITKIFRAQYLVNGAQLYNATYDPFRMGEREYAQLESKQVSLPGLLSATILEEWGKLQSVMEDPVISTVQLSDRPLTSSIRSSIREIDVNIIPEYEDSDRRSYDDYMAEIVARPSSSRERSLSRGRSQSPVVIRIPPELTATIQEEEQQILSRPLTGTAKHSMHGIHVELRAEVELKDFEQSIQNQRFIVDKARTGSPPKPMVEPEPRKSPPKSFKSSPDKTATTTARPISREATSSPKPPLAATLPPLLIDTEECKEEGKDSKREDDNESSPSQRTKLSIASLSFTKGSKVVRTISFNEDDIVDTHVQTVDETASVAASEITEEGETKKGPPASTTTSKGPVMTKATELRQKMQAQLKERLELRAKHGSNLYGGDARQSTMKYTSKTSLQKQDLQQFQKGVKQSTLAHTTSGSQTKYVVNKTAGPVVKMLGSSMEGSATGIEGNKVFTEVKSELPEPVPEKGRVVGKPLTNRYIVVKEKDQAVTLTHQMIVAKTKLFLDKSLPDLFNQDTPRQGDLYYDSNENIGPGSDQLNEDESKTQLDLDSTGFSLSIDSEIKINEDFDRPRARSDRELVREDSEPTRTGSSPRRSRSPRKTPLNELNAMVAKAQSLELDLPDLRKEKRRKYALAVSQNLARLAPEKAEAVAAAITKAAIFREEDDEIDDISIVSHYFDRNAKPIYVDRGKPPRQQLKKRKQAAGGGGSVASRSTGGASDISDLDWEDDEENEEVLEKNAALLDMYLDDLTPEERKMFENLDPESQKKLLKELRNAQGGQKRKNNTTKDLFKKLTKLATEHAKLHTMLAMEIQVELTEVTDEAITVSVNSNHSGPVIVILTATKHKYQPLKEHFYTLASIQAIPGYLDSQTIELENRSFEEVTFSSLKPETNYTIYAAINRSSRQHFPFTDEVNEEEEEQRNTAMKFPKLIQLKTLEERLEIEWSRLSQSQRTIELRAAIRSEFVHMKAFYNYPSIQLPTDEEILESRVQTLLSPATTDLDYHTLKIQHFQATPAVKHIPLFLDWWVGHGKVTSKTRAAFHEIESYYAFLNKKIQKSLAEDRIFSSKEITALTEFIKSSIKNRARLNREIEPDDALAKAGLPVIPVTDSVDPIDDRGQLMKRFRSWYKGGYVVKEMERKLLKLSSNASASGRGSSNSSLSPDRIRPGGDGGSPDSRLRSRSIDTVSTADSGSVKSGVEGDQRGLSHDTNDNNSVNSATEGNNDASNNPVVGAMALKRLQDRTRFLQSLLDPVDQCMKQIRKLYDQYESVRHFAFSVGDLKPSRRNSITTKDASSIMAAKKFYDLCRARQMVGKGAHGELLDDDEFPELELETLDPFRYLKRTKSEAMVNMTPKHAPKVFPVPMVIQRIAGCDLFRPVHVNTLKPEEPPPLELKCLPGTNRRPNKPWQSLSRAEQELELTLACTLDSIWELAVIDGIAIPNPEDRLLSPNEFPVRAFVWQEFRKWYAGEEERDPTPGQGIPTLQRVIFSEQLEMPQVEKDLFVAQLMEEQFFTVPPDYHTKKKTDDGSALSTARTDLLEDSRPQSPLPDNNDDMMSPSAPPKKQSSIKTMKQAYEKAIFSPVGGAIRNELFMQLLSRYLKSRMINMMKFLWPPGLKRMGLQYVYPRSLSFYYPKFTLPLQRLRLFPSRSHETYNREEMLSWYTAPQLEEDDLVMMRAEKKGVRQRAYHEWLTLEPQRQQYSREQMLLEDSVAYQHRELQLLLEKRWKYQEERLLRLDEDLDTGEYDPRERYHTRSTLVTLTPRALRLTRTLANTTEEAEEQEDEEEKEKKDGEESTLEDLSVGEPETFQDLNEAKDKPRSSQRRRSSTPGTNTKSPRLKDMTPRTEVSKEYSEIAFPNASLHQDDLQQGIPPGTARRNLEAQTEEFKDYIDQHLSVTEQEELNTALALYDRTLYPHLINEEQALPLIDTSKMNFRIFDSLPQEYWFFFEESYDFRNGSGIYNDDEVEAARDLERERARKAVEDALEFEKVLSLEKRRREQEEQARLKREEQDRRLKEGMVRRRKIRQHLEDLKQQRLQRQKEEEEARQKALEAERIATELEEQRVAAERYAQYLEDCRQSEIRLMEAEEVYMRDLKIRNRELKLMEHEDIMSFLIEQMTIQYQALEQEKLRELEMIYEPFEPYQFKQSRLPALEKLLVFGDVDSDREALAEELALLAETGGELGERSSLTLQTLHSKGEGLDFPLHNHSFASSTSSPVNRKGKFRATNIKSQNNTTNNASNKKQKYHKLPIPTTHDPSTISFDAIAKKSGAGGGEPVSINQKMSHLQKTSVKTSDHQPTKRKIRQFFDITKLSMDNLSKPLPGSITIDNTKEAIYRSDGDLLPNTTTHTATAPFSPPPPVAATGSSPQKKKSMTMASSHNNTPLLPFNPYDTQWELQKSPPMTLSNLPFFVRPSSQGLNPFRQRSEQTLSTPQLIVPPSISRSRPPSSSSMNLGRSHSSQGLRNSTSRGGQKPSSAGLVLAPIDFQSLQNPEVALLPSTLRNQDSSLLLLPLSSDKEVQQRVSKPSTPAKSSPSRHGPFDETDLASQHTHQTRQTTETYESEYNKTTEVTVDYINSLLAESSGVPNQLLPPYTEDELQYMQSISQSQIGERIGGSSLDHPQLLGASYSPTDGGSLISPSLRRSVTEGPILGSAIDYLGTTALTKKSKKKSTEPLSFAANLIEKNNDQKEWLEFLRLQNQLTTASLSTIDSQEKDKLRKILGKGGVLPISAQLASQAITLPENPSKKLLGKKAVLPPPTSSATTGNAAFSSTMPVDKGASTTKSLVASHSTSALPNPHTLFEQSGLDFKTFQLARTASAEVKRLKEQKEILKQYISGHAVLEEEKNEYYLLACEPKLQTQTILERNPSIQKFAQEIYQNVIAEESPQKKSPVHINPNLAASNAAYHSDGVSLAGSDNDMNSSVTGDNLPGEEEHDPHQQQSPLHPPEVVRGGEEGFASRSISPTSKRNRQRSALPYQISSVELPEIPPPTLKKPMLSSSTSKLLTQVVPSTLHAQATPLMTRKDPIPTQKKRSTINTTETKDTNKVNTSEDGSKQSKVSLNPVIFGNKLVIPKETKKDMVAKSRQLLLSKQPLSTTTSSHNANNITSSRFPHSNPQPHPTTNPTTIIPSKPTLRINTTEETKSISPRSASVVNYESSTELKSGKSIDLFIKTPRVLDPTSDSNDEAALLAMTDEDRGIEAELQRSISDI